MIVYSPVAYDILKDILIQLEKGVLYNLEIKIDRKRDNKYVIIGQYTAGNTITFFPCTDFTTNEDENEFLL
jgi:hypothetical protein